MKIGVLTGGGDCPGFNAVIRALVGKARQDGDAVVGIRSGWKGLMEGMVQPLGPDFGEEILSRGGSVLGCSRLDPFRSQEAAERCLNNFRHHGMEGLVAAGDRETLEAAGKFHEGGMPVVGIPVTGENDVAGADPAVGFDTVVEAAVEAIDRLRGAGGPPSEVFVVEVKGERTGWGAAAAAIAGGAAVCLVPEKPFDAEEVCEALRECRRKGRPATLVVAAEGAWPRERPSAPGRGWEGAGGVGEWLARQIRRRAGLEARAVPLEALQAGRVPTARDRLMATRCALKALDLVHRGRFGRMAAPEGLRVLEVPLPAGEVGRRPLDVEVYREAEIFFGS